MPGVFSVYLMVASSLCTQRKKTYVSSGAEATAGRLDCVLFCSVLFCVDLMFMVLVNTVQ